MSAFKKFLEENIFYELLLLVWILHLWTIYLTLRQIKLMKKYVDIPDAVVGLMSNEEYSKARSYSYERYIFSIVKDFYSIIVDTVLLLVNAYLLCWQWSISIGSYLGIGPENDILISGVCMFVMNFGYTFIFIGMTVYEVFVLEQKHGFNKQTPLFFVKDQIMKFVVSQVIALPILCAVIWIVKNGGDYFFLYTSLFLMVASIFIMILYPEFIAPLFDKYTPLADGELKDSINALAASVNYPLYKLFVVEGSKRSSHSNAYLYGFYKHKRIVLFDTLVKEYYKPDKDDPKKHHGCENDEVVAVIAHELGHWKYNHTWKGFVLAQVNLIIHFIVFSKLLYYPPMYAAFGFKDSMPIFIGLVISMYFVIPLNTVFHFISVVIMRRFEYQADQFGRQLGHGEALKRALVKLYKDNLAYPLFDKLYAAWNHNHPSILERLEALDKED